MTQKRMHNLHYIHNNLLCKETNKTCLITFKSYYIKTFFDYSSNIVIKKQINSDYIIFKKSQLLNFNYIKIGIGKQKLITNILAIAEDHTHLNIKRW